MMNFKSIIILTLIAYVLLITLQSSAQDKGNILPNPKIEVGTAKLSGKIIRFNPQNKSKIQLTIPKPITLEIDRIDIEVKDDGTFLAEVPLEINPTIGFIYADFFEGFTLNLEVNKETKIVCEGREFKTVSGPDFYTENNKHISDLFIKASQTGYLYRFATKDSLNRYIDDPKEIRPILKRDLQNRLEIFQNDTILSEKSKMFLNYYMKLLYLATPLQFSQVVEELYNYTREKEDTTTIKIKAPDLSYFTFLKEFDLNNPQYLYNEVYGRIFQTIFRIEPFNTPEIKETPIEEWITDFKNIFVPLTGINRGLFYDVAISQAYISQLTYQLKPLSNKQIQNINEYFGNAEIAKVILLKNEEIERLTANKGKVILNETPSVEKEKIIETIIRKYKGKAILIDFWATWCGPCIGAMKEMIPLKRELNTKDIVFVYITNPSSPKKLWDERVKGIDGEHYYLTNEEWEYISENMNVSGIPAYLIYDKEGNLTGRFTGYPGNKNMKIKLEEASK